MHDLQLVSFTRCRHHTTGAGLAPVRVTTPAPVATHDRRTRRHPSSEGNRRAAYRHCPSPPFRTGGPPGPGGALWTRTTDLGLIRTALSPPELMPRASPLPTTARRREPRRCSRREACPLKSGQNGEVVPPQRHRLDAGHPTGPARSHGPGDQAADATAAVARDADAYTTVNAATDRDSPIGRRLGVVPPSPRSDRPGSSRCPHPAHRSGRSWLAGASDAP